MSYWTFEIEQSDYEYYEIWKKIKGVASADHFSPHGILMKKRIDRNLKKKERIPCYWLHTTQ